MVLILDDLKYCWDFERLLVGFENYLMIKFVLKRLLFEFDVLKCLFIVIDFGVMYVLILVWRKFLNVMYVLKLENFMVMSLSF